MCGVERCKFLSGGKSRRAVHEKAVRAGPGATSLQEHSKPHEREGDSAPTNIRLSTAGVIVRNPFRAKHHVVVQYMARWMKCQLPPYPRPPPPPQTPPSLHGLWKTRRTRKNRRYCRQWTLSTASCFIVSSVEEAGDSQLTCVGIRLERRKGHELILTKMIRSHPSSHT